MCTPYFPPNPTDRATMPFAHEHLTTEDEVMQYFPTAKKYAGTDAGFNKFTNDTKWNSYTRYSNNEKGGATWGLEKVGGRVKTYSKSAGPYSTNRMFTRDARTWFGVHVIQMPLPYHSGSGDDHKYMVPNGDDENHIIQVALQWWQTENVKECARFYLGRFRPVRKWKQGGFWKALLVRIGSDFIENIEITIQTTIQASEKEITDLKKKRDEEDADKVDKINDLEEQLKQLNARLDETKAELDKTKAELDEKQTELDEKQAELDKTRAKLCAMEKEKSRLWKTLQSLKSEHDALKEEYNEHKKEETKEEMEKKDKEIKQLESQIKNKDRSIQHLQKRLKNKDRAYKDLQDQLKKKDRSIQDLHNHIQRLDCRHIHGLSYIPSLQECEQRSRR